MPTYNTGNPLGSVDARDLYDNAQAADEMVNSQGNTWVDRLGVVRKTLKSLEGLTPQALDAAKDAEESAAAALNAANDAEAIANRWADTTLGIANTADGRYFSVPSSVPGESSIVYQRVGSTAVEVSRLPDATLTKELAETIHKGGDAIATIVDPDGYHLAVIDRDRFEVKGFKITYEDGLDGLVLRDAEGFWVAQVLGSDTPDSPAEQNTIQARNASNIALANSIRSGVNTLVQRPVFKYSIFLTYGQSLSLGTESWPALTKQPRYPAELFMFGNAVRPQSGVGPNWQVVGTAQLNPLIATTQSNSAGGAVMSDAAVAALARGADNSGESYDVSALNMWRKQWLQWHSLMADPTRKVIVLNCGVGGKTIETLSKGHPENLYNRIIEACQAVKDWVAANDPGATIGLAGGIYDQGQANDTGYGTRDKDQFKALTKQLFADINADIGVAMFGQSQPASFFIFQTNGPSVQAVNDLSIQQAQIELANENQNIFLVGPTYGVTNKGVHLDSNGTRWSGNQVGKVMHRVLDRGEPWKPLQPIRATYTGRTALIDMLVPVPPLQLRPYYLGSVATMNSTGGFRASDAAGDIGVSVDIASDTVVRLTLSREVAGALTLWYAAAQPAGGYGNLFDSDSTAAIDSYTYAAGTGQYAEANLPALINKAYPLNNACVAFKIVAQSI